MSILDKLKKYFETTPREQIEKDWEACSKYDEVGPTVDEFLESQKESLRLNQKLVNEMSDEELDELMKPFDNISDNED